MNPDDTCQNESISDPTIDEIRAIRKRISAQFDHDPVKLIEHLMKLQQSPEIKERLLKSPNELGLKNPAA